MRDFAVSSYCVCEAAEPLPHGNRGVGLFKVTEDVIEPCGIARNLGVEEIAQGDPSGFGGVAVQLAMWNGMRRDLRSTAGAIW